MSNNSALWFANPSKGFYPFEVQNSLRFGATSGKLTRTPTSSGNQKKWTSSWWMKKTENATRTYIWSAGYTSGGSGNDGIAAFYFETDDKIHTYYDTSGSAPYGAVNNKVYRDQHSWYHFVWAVDAANTAHRIWVNGVEETLSSSSNPPDFNYGMNRAGTEQAWGTQSWGGGTHSPMVIAEAVHLDGQYLTADSFGEFKNGVWVPKDIHAQGFTFGTNGYYLNFQDDGGTNGANLGYDVQTADRSGTTNDFSLTNLNEYDQLVDTCTNNFATLSPIRLGENSGSHTFTEGNLQWTSSTYNYNATASSINIPTTGKWYMEVYVATAGSSLSHDFGVGIHGTKDSAIPQHNPAVATYGDSTVYVTRRDFASRIEKNLNNVLIADTYSYTAGDIVQVAYDADNGKVYYGLDNAYWAEDGGTDGNPSAGTNHTTTLTTGVEYFFYLSQYSNTYVSVSNFGQDSSFAGYKTSGSAEATDTNGRGNFYYTPPTDFLALCTANLPATTISPNQATQAEDHFVTHLYTANNRTAQTITGVGMQADWLWFKQRNRSDAHALYNTSMGIDKSMRITNDSEFDNSDSETGVTAVGADGFTLGTDNQAWVNYQSDSMVVWLWKANGGVTSSNGDGSKTSTVQANTTSGFSIVLYSGDTSSFTVGHGLDFAPEWVIVKSRTHSERWAVFHTSISNQYIYLNETFAGETSNADERFGNSTSVVVPSATVVTLGANNSDVSKNGENYVMYCFHSVEGFSKFGKYIGNNDTNGTFVYTGFKPAWIMIKSTGSSSNGWYIYDNKRLQFGTLVDGQLYANLTNGDDDGSRDVDFISNGFKLRLTDTNVNASGQDYIYMAFAEEPFKFTTARS